jgi:hypothetical protein
MAKDEDILFDFPKDDWFVGDVSPMYKSVAYSIPTKTNLV